MNETQRQNPVMPELDSQTIEKIMSHVQDINAPETPYTWVTPSSLDRILSEGVLSQGQYSGDKKDWAQTIKQARRRIIAAGDYGAVEKHDIEKMFVFVNITGRRIINSVERILYGGSDRIRITDGYGERDRKLSLLLDLSRYDELPPYSYYYDVAPPKARTMRVTHSDTDAWLDAFGDRSDEELNKITWEEYRARLPQLLDENGRPKVLGAPFGFAVSYNIPAKLIRGIIIGAKISLQNTIATMLDIYRASGNKSPLLPIYDYSGRLLWPKNVPYAEVKKIVSSSSPSQGNPM